MPPEPFTRLLAAVKDACAWESIPHGKISELAGACGPEEVR